MIAWITINIYLIKANTVKDTKMMNFIDLKKCNFFNQMKIFLTRTHLWLSSELKQAIFDTEKDTNYLHCLFIVYILCLSTLFFTERDPTDWNYDPAHKLYIYLLMPLTFIPFRFSSHSFFGISIPLPTKFSFYNIFRNFFLCRTPFFACLLVFTISQAAVTYSLDPHPLHFYIFFYYFLAPLLIFIMTSIRLCVDFPDFYHNFYRWTASIIAISAGINLYLYLIILPDFASIGTTRLGAIYGFPFGNNPNVDGIIYTNFLIGALLTLLHDYSRHNLFMLLLAIILLAITVLLEQTRGELLGLFVAFIALISLNFRKKRLSSIYPLLFGVANLILFTELFIPGGIITYFKRADSYRFLVWQKAFKYVESAPIFGHGIKNNLFISIPGETLMHAHSILLGAQIRSGIIGSISLMAIYILGVFQSYRYASRSNNPIPLCVFIVFAISGLFDHELKIGQAGWEWVAFWIPISFAIGADAIMREEERKEILPKICENK